MEKNTLDKIINELKNANRIGIFGHIKVDGDCIGSCLALQLALRQLGKEACIFVDSEVSYELRFLTDTSDINKLSCENFDLVVALDTSTPDRLGIYKKYFLKHKNKAIIDHHYGNDFDEKKQYVDASVSACAEIIYDLILKLGVSVENDISKYILTGIMTDTGRFKHDNVRKNTIDITNKCFQKADFEWSYLTKNLFQNVTKKRRMVEQIAHKSLQFFHDDRIAVQTIRYSEMQKIDAKIEDCGGLSKFAIDIDCVLASITITEGEKDCYYVSINSKGLDISGAACAFGGGGHKCASGCKIFGKYEKVLMMLVEEVWKTIK